jgi:4-hydroxybenzoate polyprenyltransferase
VIFFGASWAINPLCGTLAPVALLIILGYSFTKRFTLLCHYLLGLALGIAPVAGWLAVTGHFGWPPIILGLGVIFWTAGFDIIYATQDIQFDQEMRLYSLPASLGVRLALGLAASSHLLAFGLFLLSGFLSNLGWTFYLFSLITGSLLIWEHRLVSPEDLSKLDLAFFRANSMVSLSLFLAVCAGLMA